MHGGDGHAHQQRAERQARPRQRLLAHQPQGEGRGGDGDQQRGRGEGEVVAEVDRQVEGEHADEVHRPDAHAHGEGAAGQPQGNRAARRGRDAAGHVECGVGSENGDDQGENDQDFVVAADKHEYSALQRGCSAMNIKDAAILISRLVLCQWDR
ncbi:hypothetical protein D9M70_311020 [compost metagenome]